MEEETNLGPLSYTANGEPQRETELSSLLLTGRGQEDGTWGSLDSKSWKMRPQDFEFGASLGYLSEDREGTRHVVLQVKDLIIQVAERKFDPRTHMRRQMWCHVTIIQSLLLRDQRLRTGH